MHPPRGSCRPQWGRKNGRWLFGLLAVAASLCGPASAQVSPPQPLPSFVELEAAGTRVGTIRVVAQDVFDTADPREDKLLFRWANALHIQTRPGVIERAMLFKPGDPVSVRLIEETERLLRSYRYLYDVQLRPVALHDGVVDIEVATRDTWSLDPGVRASRAGGANSSGIQLSDQNLFGTGSAVSIERLRNIDRSSTQFQFVNDRAFGTWASVNFSHAVNSDGRRDAAAVTRPFYALDTRWSAGVSASRDDRIDALYNAGTMVSQYRRRQNQAELFGGWSAGLVGGWVHRYTVGVAYRDDGFAPEPGLAAPAELPANQRLVTPFVRHALIEDRFTTDLNRNLIGRPEYFALGFASTLQLGRASTGLGSSRNAWVYAASISRGFQPVADHLLMTTATLSGEQMAQTALHQHLGMQAQYYLPQGKRWLFYAAVAADWLHAPGPDDLLLLGGDNGLRGYPLRYQSGTRRALATVEERFYTDLYLWRLLRVGGAAFFDAGRAWGGSQTDTQNAGWLGNLGLGLRIVSARAAFSNVLHIDIALPLRGAADVQKTQFLVRTKSSF